MKKVGQLFREKLVSQIKEGIDNNSNVFLFRYSNVSGGKIDDLRKTLKNSGARMFVSKNSIAKIALKDLEHETLCENIEGQTAFVWADTDAVEVSKILMGFTKECKTASVQGGLLEGKVISQAQVLSLSELPSKEVLLAMLLAAMKSPLTRFASALNAKTKDLLSVLKQLSEKKGGK